MQDPLRIVHCDDSESFSLLVRDWLEDHPDVEVVHTAHGIREAIDRVREVQPDVVVTDTLGASSDPRYLTWLRDAAPRARLVVFTGYLRSQLHPDVVALADAIVTKGIDESELVRVLRSLPRARD